MDPALVSVLHRIFDVDGPAADAQPCAESSCAAGGLVFNQVDLDRLQGSEQ